jgi:hypothetical protein
MARIYDIGYPDPRTGKPTDPIEQGATYRLPFTVTNIFSDAGVGCLIRGSMKLTFDAVTGVDFNCTILTTTPDLLTGLIELDATSSAPLVPGEYVYDVEIEDASGFVQKLVKGKALVAPEVTKTVIP